MSLRRVTAWALVAASVVIAFGCSALISADLGRVNCVAEGYVGPPACPVGKICHANVCVGCVPFDTCGNGFDDDCNGIADDGCDDGGLGGQGGGAGQGGTSGAGETGGMSGGGGTAPGGGGGTGATGGVAGSGGTGGTTSLGSPCSADTECPLGAFCSAPSTHGASSNTKICVIGCCTSDQCGGGVCYPAAGGYGICLPAAAAGRPAVGAKATGSSCAGDAECKSAYCDNGLCTDLCCSDSNCPANFGGCALQVEKFTGRSAFVCSQQSGSGYQANCTYNDDCSSAACVTPTYKCTRSCCSRKDCNGSQAYQCAYYDLNGGGTFRVCLPPLGTGSTANGAPCNYSDECQSGLCVDTGSGGFCSDTCCQDGDCGDPTSFKCRPLTPVNPSGSPAQLLCVPG